MINAPNQPTLSSGGAAVLLSGGQDSTTCLAWACKRFAKVATVSFDYGQRHKVELEQADKIAKAFGVERVTLSVPALSEIGAASLTNKKIPNAMNAKGTGNTYAERHSLPSSFVPARNAVLLSTAAAWAAPNELMTLVTGVCEADDAGYPDCRGPFIEAIELSLRIGLAEPQFSIAAPLLTLDKAKTFALAADLGHLDEVLELSHTCYEGDRSTRHEYGYGCGVCGACRTRKAGWREYQSSLATA
jgi:7-cyano-7-deazaguanine synthase